MSNSLTERKHKVIRNFKIPEQVFIGEELYFKNIDKKIDSSRLLEEYYDFLQQKIQSINPDEVIYNYAREQLKRSIIAHLEKCDNSMVDFNPSNIDVDPPNTGTSTSDDMHTFANEYYVKITKEDLATEERFIALQERIAAKQEAAKVYCNNITPDYDFFSGRSGRPIFRQAGYDGWSQGGSGICGAQGPFKHKKTDGNTYVYWKCGPMVPDIRNTLENINRLRHYSRYEGLFHQNCAEEKFQKRIACKNPKHIRCSVSAYRTAVDANGDCKKLRDTDIEYLPVLDEYAPQVKSLYGWDTGVLVDPYIVLYQADEIQRTPRSYDYKCKDYPGNAAFKEDGLYGMKRYLSYQECKFALKTKYSYEEELQVIVDEDYGHGCLYNPTEGAKYNVRGMLTSCADPVHGFKCLCQYAPPLLTTPFTKSVIVTIEKDIDNVNYYILYQDEEGQKQCKWCPPGEMSNVGGVNGDGRAANFCTEINTQFVSIRTFSSDGFIKNDNGGWHRSVNNIGLQRCGPNTVPNNKRTSCVACPNGRKTMGDNLYTNSIMGADSCDCVKCPAGKYMPDLRKYSACDGGYFSINSTAVVGVREYASGAVKVKEYDGDENDGRNKYPFGWPDSIDITYYTVDKNMMFSTDIDKDGDQDVFLIKEGTNKILFMKNFKKEYGNNVDIYVKITNDNDLIYNPFVGITDIDSTDSTVFANLNIDSEFNDILTLKNGKIFIYNLQSDVNKKT